MALRVKFYTDEGHWDLVGTTSRLLHPGRDEVSRPSCTRPSPSPHFAMPQAGSAHEHVLGLCVPIPKSPTMLMWRCPKSRHSASYRTSRPFRRQYVPPGQRQGESSFVKFQLEPKAGTHSLVWDEAVKISGADSDFHRRDLWEAIEAGAYPEWELGLQIFTEEQAEGFTFDVLDATKIVPEELVPIVPVGRMVLNRNPDNFFAETEQVRSASRMSYPASILSNDPLLEGRNPFVCRHTDLATGWTELP